MRLMHPPATLTVQAVKSSLADSFCALKEQKEGESVPTAYNFVDIWVCNPFPFALTARQLAYTSLSRALLWAVFLLRLPPVLARNICCTISWTMFLLGLRPALAHYRRCCTMPRCWYYLQSCSLHFNKYGWLHISKYGWLYISKYGLFHISKDGLKAQKVYSPEQRSGYSWLSILRSERARGKRKCADCIQFCWYMGMCSFFLLRLQRAS